MNRGERHHKATCSDREVQLALELLRGGMSVREVAAKFEVTDRAVRRWRAGTSRRVRRPQ